MSKETTRALLLETGQGILMEKGYNHTGVQEILQVAGVPKGTFYYYFDSKETFALQVINKYTQAHDATLERFLGDETLTPLQRLRQHAKYRCEQFEALQCREGCLIGSFALELSNQSEPLRVRTEQVLTSWRERYASCFLQAQEAGEVPSFLDPHALAQFYVSAWEGALLQGKATRSSAPLRSFIEVMFDQFLKS